MPGTERASYKSLCVQTYLGSNNISHNVSQ
nr:MAG TPA: hypothetical protein [Caudoviricetes sp.]